MPKTKPFPPPLFLKKKAKAKRVMSRGKSMGEEKIQKEVISGNMGGEDQYVCIWTKVGGSKSPKIRRLGWKTVGTRPS